eukprot:COSAG06_NODE_2727_length_6383_cov_3.025939_2_plen_579_part_00
MMALFALPSLLLLVLSSAVTPTITSISEYHSSSGGGGGGGGSSRSTSSSGSTVGCGALANAAGPTLLSSGDSDPQFIFGTAAFALTFDTFSLALLNVTSCAPAGGREQGFLWPVLPQKAARFSLWQLNHSSDCTAGTPGGSQLDALSSVSASRNHSVQQMDDGRHVLTLRWLGLAIGSGSEMDVTVTVTMNDSAESGSTPAEAAALRGSVAIRGTPACILSMTLPNFERMVLRSPAQDKLFTPWFFGQVGDQTNLCGGGDCTLDLKQTSVMDGEHALMPNGNERSMQWAALYSSPASEPSPAAPAPAPPPLGLYIGAHSPSSDLMMLLMQGAYCAAPPPPGFKPNGYTINSTIKHGVDSGSAGGDLGGLKATAWDECAHACGSNPLCRAWVWNNKSGFCYPKSRAVAPKKYPGSEPDVYGCSPGYPVAGCIENKPLGPPLPPSTDCGSHAGLRWLHFPENSLQATTNWTMNYDVVLAAFEGDWWDAAMIYRDWVLASAVWTRAGNLTTRMQSDPGYPHWLLKAPLWTKVSSDAPPPLPGKKLPSSCTVFDPNENIELAAGAETETSIAPLSFFADAMF